MQDISDHQILCRLFAAIPWPPDSSSPVFSFSAERSLGHRRHPFPLSPPVLHLATSAPSSTLPLTLLCHLCLSFVISESLDYKGSGKTRSISLLQNLKKKNKSNRNQSHRTHGSFERNRSGEASAAQRCWYRQKGLFVWRSRVLFDSWYARCCGWQSFEEDEPEDKTSVENWL